MQVKLRGGPRHPICAKCEKRMNEFKQACARLTLCKQTRATRGRLIAPACSFYNLIISGRCSNGKIFHRFCAPTRAYIHYETMTPANSREAPSEDRLHRCKLTICNFIAAQYLRCPDSAVFSLARV